VVYLCCVKILKWLRIVFGTIIGIPQMVIFFSTCPIPQGIPICKRGGWFLTVFQTRAGAALLPNFGFLPPTYPTPSLITPPHYFGRLDACERLLTPHEHLLMPVVAMGRGVVGGAMAGESNKSLEDGHNRLQITLD